MPILAILVVDSSGNTLLAAKQKDSFWSSSDLKEYEAFLKSELLDYLDRYYRENSQKTYLHLRERTPHYRSRKIGSDHHIIYISYEKHTKTNRHLRERETTPKLHYRIKKTDSGYHIYICEGEKHTEEIYKEIFKEIDKAAISHNATLLESKSTPTSKKAQEMLDLTIQRYNSKTTTYASGINIRQSSIYSFWSRIFSHDSNDDNQSAYRACPEYKKK